MDISVARNHLEKYNTPFPGVAVEINFQRLLEPSLETIHQAAAKLHSHYLAWTKLDTFGKHKADQIDQNADVFAAMGLTAKQAKEISFFYHASLHEYNGSKAVQLVAKSIKFHLVDVFDVAKNYSKGVRSSLMSWLGINVNTWVKLAWGKLEDIAYSTLDAISLQIARDTAKYKIAQRKEIQSFIQSDFSQQAEDFVASPEYKYGLAPEVVQELVSSYVGKKGSVPQPLFNLCVDFFDFLGTTWSELLVPEDSRLTFQEYVREAIEDLTTS